MAESINQKDNIWTKKSGVECDTHINSNNIHLQNNLPQNNNSTNLHENRRARNRKNKKHHNMETEFNVRKCSDTSLEPTPEKTKGKRIRYIEKKD
jgi:hypothetical protein